MSTAIKSVYAVPDEVRDLVIGRIGRHVNVMAERGFGRTVAIPDFLAAVETECGVRIVAADAIVIDRAELPEVTARDGRVSAKVFTWSDSDPDDLREVAACYLAAAEYLAAHPPVPPVSDEDVEALAGLVRDALGVTPETIAAGHLRQGTSDQVARYLLTTCGPNGEHLSVTR